ncbi:MAG: DUF4345 domain-containing protein [Parvularculaceae bacterium]|nr:DUF4345 domain-containing protein [Parvularculaceae bacterium]
MRPDDAALLLVAFAFAGMGLGALVAPRRVLALFGVDVLSAAGRNEVRAVYGGFGLAMAGALIVALGAPSLRLGIVLTLALALFGMAAGRIVSALIDRRLDRAAALFLVVEIVAGALLIFGAD